MSLCRGEDSWQGSWEAYPWPCERYSVQKQVSMYSFASLPLLSPASGRLPSEPSWTWPWRCADDAVLLCSWPPEDPGWGGGLPSPSVHMLSKHCSTGTPSTASSGGFLTSPSLGQTEARAPSSSPRICNSLPGSGPGP